MILRRFLYLDDIAVDGYLSALEDGSRQSIERESQRSGDLGGSAHIGPIGADAKRSKGTRQSETASDTPQAKYSRLSVLAQAQPETWTEVLEPDMLDVVGKGEIIEIEADLYVPDAVKLLQPGGDVHRLFDAMEGLSAIQDMFGSIEGMPSRDEREAMRTAISALPANLVVVGEVDDSDWKVAGQLNRDHLLDPDLDGPATIVGKVARKWSADEWKPLLALPGMSLLPREQRRQLERQRPATNAESQFLPGPGVTLDVLAIYR